MAALLHHAFISPGLRQDPSRPKPVSASTLASIEKQRRDRVTSLGPCRSGCEDLDNYVLLGGGFERGSVVGISAEDEDGVGVTLGLQVLVCSLLDNAAQKVQVVTPKPPSTIVVLLKNGITAELKARGVTAVDEITARRRDCLDRILLSRVFDMDGLGEVLAELDATGVPGDDDLVKPGITAVKSDAAATVASVEKKPQEEPSIMAEIQDSQDEDETPSPSPPPATTTIPQPDAQFQDVRELDDRHIADKQVDKDDDKSNMAVTTPDIILITHFSSLLTSFFTQREKSAAHATLRLLASRLRHLSRALPSSPLIILINSTDSGAASSSSTQVHASESHSHENPPPEQPITTTETTYKSTTDPTLRSIFNPAPPHTHGYKPNKPTFGLVFTQLLDLHLLCTRAPRPSKAASPRAMTVVEVLLDEIGLWEGKRGRRRRREQRWTIVASHNSRILSVTHSEKQKGTE